MAAGFMAEARERRASTTVEWTEASPGFLLLCSTLLTSLLLFAGGTMAQTFTGNMEVSGPFASGNQTFQDNSTFNADAADAASGGRQTFYDTSSLNVTTAGAITGGRQEFYDSSIFNALAADAISNGTIQDFADDSVLKASVSNAITGGTQFFYDDSRLEASARNALNGGEQYFNQQARIDASAADGVSGGMQFFNDDSALDAGVTDAVSGGIQVFSGNSSLNASAANAVSGGSQIFQGTSTLNATAAGALGDVVVMLSGNADVQIGATDALTNETELQFGSTDSALALNGYSTRVGKLSNMFSGTGTIENGGEDDAALTVDTSQLGDSLFKGVIQDGGGGKLALTKEGTGSLTLTGTSTYTGATTVSGGTLTVNGSIASSAITVEDGATLSGSGTVGSTTLNSGAVIRPGGPATTLTISGDLIFNDGSRYEVEADPASADSSLIRVTGTVSLAGGSVVQIGSQCAYRPFSTYTILTADGGIEGAFDEVVSDFAFLTPDLLYVGNDVRLTLLRNDIAFADKAATRNQIATANGAESLGRGRDLYDAILLLADDEARVAFDQLSGEIHASAKTMLIEDSRFLRQTVMSRLNMSRDNRAEGGATNTGAGMIEPAADLAVALPSSGFWMSGFGSWGNGDGDGNAASLDRSVGGSFIGADARLGQGRLGLLGGYSRTSVDADDRNSSGRADGYHIGLYGDIAWQGFVLRAGAAYTWSEIETERQITNPVRENLKAEYGTGTAQLFGEAAYQAQFGDLAVEPFVQAAYVTLSSEGFRETGGSAALRSKAARDNSLVTTLGVRPRVEFSLAETKARAFGLIGWQRVFGDITPESRFAFAGGADFTIRGAPMARDSALIEAGLDLALGGSLSLGAAYQGRFGAAVSDSGFTARLGVSF